MKYSYTRAILWLFIYLLLALIPMAIAISGEVPQVRSFWIEVGVAMGFIGLAMFALQFLFSGRFTSIAPTFGMDNILQFHKYIGIVAFFFVLAHPITLIIANPEFLEYFNPRVNFLRAIALSFASLALIFIMVTSLWRVTFKLNYEKWRLIHGFLALSLVFIGVVHSLQVGHYLDELWKKIALATVMGGSMYLVIHTRIVRPWLSKSKPYKIVDVQEERDECYTITMEPIGHERMKFIAGQFAWITINDSPFSLQQHPFSFASGEEDKFLKFTAKESGDFTSTWKSIEKGTKAFLEGPFGSFTIVPEKNLFLVMGGIGVTPAMSMLRTLKQRNDKRKVILIYGSEDRENITFREELDELKNELNMDLVHILLEPDDDWDGETGYVDQDFLERFLPKNKSEFIYFICGPGPLMDITEISLRNLGIDWRFIYSERFKIV